MSWVHEVLEATGVGRSPGQGWSVADSVPLSPKAEMALVKVAKAMPGATAAP